MNATIQKWGNSQAIRLPKALLELVKMGENFPVVISTEGEKIIIEKQASTYKHKTLEERLQGFEGDLGFVEWDTGPPVGEEIF
ncbi:multidrug transporter MatE [Clostridia bacterium]|nr:multidrug transporter MatE [Clostridia bacterium]